MGRRNHLFIGTAIVALSLCLAAGTVVARPEDAPPSPPKPAADSVDSETLLSLPEVSKAKPKVPSKAPAKPEKEAETDTGEAPGELPSDLVEPAENNLGPEPPSYAPPTEDLPPAPAVAAPTSDPAVERAQAAGTPVNRATPAAAPQAATPADGGPLAPAIERPGQPVPQAVGAPKETEPSFVLPADRLQIGRQSVGLTLDFVAPQTLNLNQTANLKIVVKNNGANDALGVVVRDELPPTLTFVSSQPEATKLDTLLSWNLGTISPGSEKVITLSVKPTKVGPFDHAATVTMMSGGKSRTTVREPKLKVEQQATSGKILKGQPVQFKIVVSNPGDGPARKVTVQAKLSDGLRHESGEPNDQKLLEQTIELIGPGERVALDTLVADTLLKGDQTCEVVAQSADVVNPSPDARNVSTVTVIAPELKLTLTGPKDRYTDTLGTYDITLDNPGTAPAKNVKVQATLPVSGRLYALPSGAKWDPQTRKLIWTRSQLDAGEKAVLSFQVRVGGIGLYQIAAESRADGTLFDKQTMSTDVTGLADVIVNVSEKRRVVDVDGETTFIIKVVNGGTKEATRLSFSAVLSENLEPIQTSGTDEPAKFSPPEHKLVFPMINRLGPNQSMELGVKVKATKPGQALCRVSLLHDEITEKLVNDADFRVMPVRR